MPNDDDLYGRPGNEAAQGYSPMPEATPREPEEEPEIYSSDRDGLLDATEDLIKSRGGERSEPDTVDRGYQYLRGEHAGEPVEENRTLDIEKAASDLAKQRAGEVQAIELQENTQLRDAVDSAKGVATETEVADWVAQQQAQQLQQAQAEPPPPGVDAELYALIRDNPKVSAALQAEVAQVTRAQQHFTQAASESTRLAFLSVVASVPELSGLHPSQYATALDIVSRQNPQRGLEIRQHLTGSVSFTKQHAGARQQSKIEQQKSAAQLQSCGHKSSVRSMAGCSRERARAKAVGTQVAELFQSEYGVSRAELTALAQSQPLLHSDVGQRLIIDALSYRQALKTATANPARAPLPPVHRPGTAPARYSGSDGDVEQLRAEFTRNANPRTAARWLAAQRRAS